MTQRQFGRYEIIAELGEGGMATVYRAFDPRFRREVALKILPARFLDDPAFRGRFEREAQSVAALEHPAIVPVYDFGETENQPYLVMRLMTGGSLAERLEKGPLSLSEISRIFQRLASALDAAHRHGIIHRDLKPANILFDQYDEPYLADFGIVKWAGEGDVTKALTGTGAAVGTPAYMSPEQVQGQDLDGRSDVYALGVILFEMLSGKRPYEATTPMALAVKHVTEPIPKLEGQHVPSACQTLINQAMAKNPDERYKTAAAFAQALQSVAGGHYPNPDPVPSPEPESKPATSPSTTGPTEIILPTPPPTRPRTPTPQPSPLATPIAEPKPERGRNPPLPLLAGGGVLALLLCVAGIVALLYLLDVLPPVTEESTPTSEVAEHEPGVTTVPDEGGEVVAPAVIPDCPDPLGCVYVPAGEPVEIGLLQTFGEGMSDISGIDQVRGVELAVAEQERILNHPIITNSQDELCSGEGGVGGASILLENPQIVGVIGTTCDEAAIAAAPLFSEAGWVLISGANSNAELTQFQGEPGAAHVPGYFRTIPNNEWQGQVAAAFVRQELGISRVATLYTETFYGGQLRTIFNTTVANLGGSVAVDIPLVLNDQGWADIVQTLLEAEIELIYLPVGYSSTIDAVIRIRTTPELEHVLLMASTTALSETFLGSVGEYGVGLYAAAPLAPTNDRYNNYRDLFRAAYQTEPTDAIDFSVYAYDATYLLFQAIEQVAQVGEDGSLLIGREALREAIAATHAYPGAAGELFCDVWSQGDCGNPVIAISRLEDPNTGLDAFRHNTVYQADVNLMNRATLTIWYPDFPGSAGEEALLQVVDRARASFPNFILTTRAIPPDDLAERWREAVQFPDGPDLLVHPNGFLSPSENAALDMTDWVGERANNLEMTARQSLQVDGRQMGLPLASQVVVMYVNQSLVPEPPQTLEELLALAQSGQTVALWQTPYHLFGFFPAFGAEVTDGSTACPDSELPLVASLRYLLSLQEAGAIFSRTISEAQELFQQGEVAIILDGSWSLQAYAAALGDDLAVYPVPPALFAFQPLNDPPGVYISPNTPDPNTAVDLALFFTGAEAQEIFMTVGWTIPVQSGVALPDELRQNMVEAAAAARPWRNDGSLDDYWDIFTGLFVAVFEEERVPAVSVAAACTVYQTALDNR